MRRRSKIHERDADDQVMHTSGREEEEEEAVDVTQTLVTGDLCVRV